MYTNNMECNYQTIVIQLKTEDSEEELLPIDYCSSKVYTYRRVLLRSLYGGISVVRASSVAGALIRKQLRLMLYMMW